LPAQKNKAVSQSKQISKGTNADSKSKGKKTTAAKTKDLNASKSPVKKKQTKAIRTSEIITYGNKPHTPKVSSKPKQAKKKTPRKKEQELPNMRRSISILLLGIIIVSIYALFTENLSILSKSTKGAIIIFLFFLGFNCLLVFLGYRIGVRKNRR
jgi:cation transport ATPase